jgi:transcriptional regulator with XRE-family HTH domain
MVNAMIRAAREKLGLTRAELASQAGVSVRNIENWEQGHRRPRIDVVLRLASILGIKSDDMLLAWAKDMSEKKGGA